jgi:tetrahydromethanopterin S-methyltransferase subunit G
VRPGFCIAGEAEAVSHENDEELDVHRSIRTTFALFAVLGLAACGGEAGAESKGGPAKSAGGDSAGGGAAKGQPAAAPAPKFAFGNSAAEAQQCMQRRQARLDSAATALRADSAARRPGAGKNPIFAKDEGWYPRMPEFRDGSILPCNRIVVYYGNPSSTRMGALGQYPRDEMLARLRRQADQWAQADPGTPVIPGLHLIAVVAQGDPGPSGRYRTQIRDAVVDSIHQMAKSINGILFIDVQVGTDDIRNIMPRFDEFLKRPDVHFAVDPEFYMRGGVVPGRRIGTMYAADINWVMDHLTQIVQQNNLPPKVLIIHRFTRGMVPDVENVRLRPEVQLVMHMDGWGAPWLKYDSYRDYIVAHPAQFTGWKNFYHNDTKKGDPLTTPQDLLQLWPEPLYVQYQ